MNAKKIMGAVLVALLAAALFVGAGAATSDYKGTFFAYQTGATDVNGAWTNGDNKVTVTDGKVSAVPVPGTYTQGDYTAYFTNPTASYSALGTISVGGTVEYIVDNGGKVYTSSTFVLTPFTSVTGIGVSQVFVTYPSGLVANMTLDAFNAIAPFTEKGTYKVQALFDKSKFITGVNSKYLIDTLNSFTFTVVDAEDATLSASVDKVYNGEYVTFTIEGSIGQEYTLELVGFGLTGKDQVVPFEDDVEEENGEEKLLVTFTMPNSGVATFQFVADAGDEDEATAKLIFDEEEIDEVEIAISAAELTATLGAPSYYIGDEIIISGTSTSDLSTSKLSFTITGTNFKETLLDYDESDAEKNEFGKTWKVALITDGVTEENDGKKGLDVASYTIKIYQANYANQDALETAIAGENGEKPVKTVVVKLNQPFISIIEAPEVVTQGTEAKFIINAEATEYIRYYIFGTNFFFASENVDNDKGIANQFTAKLSKLQTKAENMSTGQYFMVIQHPMYDKQFNIAADNDAFYLNTSVTADEDNGQLLFNVNKCQTANAAQALCDALDSQNIDDMYVKYSFFVVGEDESFTISDIPKEIAKGTTLVISGVDTANADATVIVEMVSTAFAAVPKETVGSAAFVAVTTEVAEDGTWEVTLDTSELNIDEYALTVKIAEDVKKNVNINVVEAADEPVTPPTDKPDEPVTPPQDDAPETPGFGALAALAGLGAVAVLLLRRE